MRRTRTTSRGGLIALVGAACLGLSACGAGTAAPSADSSTSAGPSATEAAATTPWLLRFDSYVGEDGEAKQATYVSVVPRTGATRVVTMPVVRLTQSLADAQILLVDAAHRWALSDSRPSRSDRSKGLVTMRDLSADGKVTRLDVRKATGDSSLVTDWASFDPTTPGLLRVVSGAKVWSVDVNAGTAEASGTLPRRAGWIYAGGFAKNTGIPYIEDTGSFDTLPAGNGEDEDSPVIRSGGTVLHNELDRPYGDRPAPGCETSAGFVSAAGDAWAFCMNGRSLQARVLEKGGETWRDVGKPTAAVVPVESDPVYVVPGQAPRS